MSHHGLSRNLINRSNITKVLYVPESLDPEGNFKEITYMKAEYVCFGIFRSSVTGVLQKDVLCWQLVYKKSLKR